MAKTVHINFIHPDTKVAYHRCGSSYCIAFDFGGRDMKGFGTNDPKIALQLSKYFKQMAAQLKANKKPRVVGVIVEEKKKKIGPAVR